MCNLFPKMSYFAPIHVHIVGQVANLLKMHGVCALLQLLRAAHARFSKTISHHICAIAQVTLDISGTAEQVRETFGCISKRTEL